MKKKRVENEGWRDSNSDWSWNLLSSKRWLLSVSSVAQQRRQENNFPIPKIENTQIQGSLPISFVVDILRFVCFALRIKDLDRLWRKNRHPHRKTKKGHIAQPTESSKFVHACHNLFFWTCSALFFLAIFISSSLALPLLSDADAAGGWYKLGAKVLINFQDIFRPPTRLPSFVDRSRLWPVWNRKSCLSFSWLSRH